MAREPALARDADSEFQKLKLRGVVRVRVDCALHAFRFRERPPAPVHVEAARVCIDLDDGSSRGSGLDDRGVVHCIAIAHEQQAACDMAEHGHVFVFHRADDALRHLSLRKVKDIVDARDGVIELRENLVVEVERTVLVDVHLAAREDAEIRAEFLVKLLDFLHLCEQAFVIETVRLERCLRVIRDAQILQTELHRGIRHFAQ